MSVTVSDGVLQKQTWQWTDGSTFDFTPWFWAQSEDDNETCVEMNYTGASHLHLRRTSEVIGSI